LRRSIEIATQGRLAPIANEAAARSAIFTCWGRGQAAIDIHFGLPSARLANMSDDKKSSKQRQIEELIFIKIPQVTAGTLFLIAVAINIVNVIGRYIFSTPVFWAEETLSFMMIWVVFLVAGSITYRGAHLNMDLVYSILPAAWKHVVRIAVVIALIVCALFTAFQSLKIVTLHFHNHSMTAGTEIPLAIPASALLFGFSFIAVAAMVRLRSYLTGNFD